jgi:hypothetical protein
MEFEDYETLQDWLEDQLEDAGEKWTDVIYHNLTVEELSKKWCDDVQRIYIWTKNFVYFQCDSEDCGIFMDYVYRNPPFYEFDKCIKEFEELERAKIT